jgi:prepilin-type N-terminal cleavage/methylation domain-containing protein
MLCTVMQMRRPIHRHGQTAGRTRGFSLIEVTTALAILAVICSSVMVAMNRLMDTADDVTMKMRAFTVARENLEQVLVLPSAGEMTEYGTSTKYPMINWETTVETFAAPIMDKTWSRVICRAEYEDIEGQMQTVELTHWLSELTDAQLQAQDESGDALDPNELCFSKEEAAEYAGVPHEIIDVWLGQGMVQADDGSFIKKNLDLFKTTNGDPSPMELDEQLRSSGMAAPDAGQPDTGLDQSPDLGNARPGGRQPRMRE